MRALFEVFKAFKVCKVAFAALLLVSGAAWGCGCQLEPFSASYTADASQVPFGGTASRSLSAEGANRWQLSFSASMLVASINEKSRFLLHEGQWRPLQYVLKRSGLGKTRETELSFDWQQKKVSGSHRDKPVQLALTPGVLDKSTYQIALQGDVSIGMKTMSYRIIDGDEIETLRFRVVGEEPVKTEVGSIASIKVERVREEGKDGRQTRLWFAKDWGFLLVRLEQVEKDGKSYQIMLKEGTVGGRSVKGD